MISEPELFLNLSYPISKILVELLLLLVPVHQTGHEFQGNFAIFQLRTLVIGFNCCENQIKINRMFQNEIPSY